MSIANATYTRSTSLAPNQARNYPRFFIETMRDENASRQNGREMFRDEERVEIVMPGNPYTRPVMRVTDEHRQIWPKQYEAFKAGQEIAIDGTPLEAWALNCTSSKHSASGRSSNLPTWTTSRSAGLAREGATCGATRRRSSMVRRGWPQSSS